MMENFQSKVKDRPSLRYLRVLYFACICECHIEGYYNMEDKSFGIISEEDAIWNHCVEASFCCDDLGIVGEDERIIDIFKENIPEYIIRGLRSKSYQWREEQ